MTTPTAGRLGRLAVKAPPDRFAIAWAHEYLATPFAAPTYPIDVSGGIGDWDMLGNDQYGDCGVAARYHLSMSTAVAAGRVVPRFTADEVVAEYLGYDEGRDVGVNLADYLLWCFHKGHIKAFAPINHASKTHVDWALEHGYGVYVGANLTDADMGDFNSQREWGAEGDPRPNHDLGHCILKVKADGAGKDVYVTWGSMQAATEQWTSSCVEEAWLVVSDEEQLANFTPQLLADIAAIAHGIGGAPAPAPAPTPAPAPVPTPPSPTPVPPSHDELHRILAQLRELLAELERLLQ